MNTIDKLSYITNLLFNKIEDTEIDLSEEECDNIVNYSKDIRKELRRSEKLEKVVEMLKKEDLIIGTDESDKDLPCLVMAMKFEDKIIIFYETMDKNKIDLLKEVFKCN